MPHWDPNRWVYNEDGSYTRRSEPTEAELSTLDEDAPELAERYEDADDDTYNNMTKAQLSELLESRGLPKTGTKQELIDRLEEADLG